MSAGIDINSEELDILVSVAKDYTALVTASTITLGQGGQGGFRGLTNAQIITLISRYRNARTGESKTGI